MPTTDATLKLRDGLVHALDVDNNYEWTLCYVYLTRTPIEDLFPARRGRLPPTCVVCVTRLNLRVR